VYRSYPGEFVLLQGYANNLNLVLISQNYVVVEGITLRNQNYFTMPKKRDYWVSLEGKHITFRRCRMIADGDPYYNIYTLNAWSRGIVDGGQYNIIEYCFLRGLDIGSLFAGAQRPAVQHRAIRYRVCQRVEQHRRHFHH